MQNFSYKKHRHYLEDEAGLLRLIEDKIAESRYVDYKTGYETRDPKYRDDVRIDIASLSTSGRAFLVIGVDESRDGNSFATAVDGLDFEEALTLRQSIESLCQTKISPPVQLDSGVLVELASGKVVIVFKIKGRKGIPAAIEKRNGETVNYIRNGSNNTPLSFEQAELQRNATFSGAGNPRRTRVLVAATVLAALLLAFYAVYRVEETAKMDAVYKQSTPIVTKSEQPDDLQPSRYQLTSEDYNQIHFLSEDAFRSMRSGNFDAATAALNKVESIEGTWKSAFYLGRIAFNKDEFENSQALFSLAEDRYIALYSASVPEYEGMRKNEVISRFEQKARERMSEGGFFAVVPQLSLIYLNMVGSLLKLDRKEEALVVAYRSVLLSGGRHDAAQANLGSTLRALGRYREAEAELRKAISLNSSDAISHVNLGEVLRGLGRDSEAKKEFQTGLSIAPKNSEAWAGLGELSMGEGDFRLAVDAFERCRDINPDNASARSNLCVSLMRLGKFDEAISECKKATKIEPGSYEFWVNYGFSLFEKRKADRAIVHQSQQAFEHALNFKRDGPEAHLGLANCFSFFGDKQKARELYEQFLGLALQQDCCKEAYGKVISMLGLSPAIQKGPAAEKRSSIRVPPSAAVLNSVASAIERELAYFRSKNLRVRIDVESGNRPGRLVAQTLGAFLETHSLGTYPKTNTWMNALPGAPVYFVYGKNSEKLSLKLEETLLEFLKSGVVQSENQKLPEGFIRVYINGAPVYHPDGSVDIE